MKIILLGANGQLGSALYRVLTKEHAVTGLTHGDIEIADRESIRRVLLPLNPDLIINTTAFHNVPECEKDPARAFAVNATAQRDLADVCHECHADFLYYSTDYVFDGAKHSPYVEEDAASPLNIYGASKLAGEAMTRARTDRHYIVRSSGLYGHDLCRAKGGNFADKMLKLASEKEELRIVNDEILTPTFVEDIALKTAELLATRAYGTYHMTNGGQCSWYEFACEIFRLTGTKVRVVPVPASEFPSPVKRPLYSVLKNKALSSIGLPPMPMWRESLARFLGDRKMEGC